MSSQDVDVLLDGAAAVDGGTVHRRREGVCASRGERRAGVRARARRRVVAVALVGALAGAVLTACGDAGPRTPLATRTTPAPEPITVSGSTTVAPVTRAVAKRVGTALDVTEQTTAEGFARFCAGESAINNASLPIPGRGQPVDFVDRCRRNGVRFVEIPIGLDAVTLVRNEANRFARDLTLDEVARIWAPDSTVRTWRDVRPNWPDRAINFYGRAEGTATYDYFSHAATGGGALRPGFRTSTDMRALAHLVAEDPDGLGFLGIGSVLSARSRDRDRIATVSVDGVEPGPQESRDGRYRRFTRPLLLYVNVDAARSDGEISRFVDFYVRQVERILPRVYFYPMDHESHERAARRWESRTTGTMFGGDPFADVDLRRVLERS